ncbi:DUF262 domain-containing protein [Exiguobacterium antarcticum]|uniref:DUF262 domain-containing protein n=1 Tax=Exiguobacterium antarcticum TaxID=132920 RepID=A0ABT6R7A0_9BACL|nr:DUF262 domain-containing protein [Exiguobacterium antarcticum]MDI3236171.1 DUF262 domain-containing protein [Exiguobacterium antarcticum]
MLEIKNNSWPIKQLSAMAEKSTVRFDYPIQRAGGQWDLLQQSYLIHTAGSSYPIPPVYAVSYLEKNSDSDKDVQIRYILDGKQRLTTLFSFIKDEWALDKMTPEITIEDETFEVAGKLFSELDDMLQLIILSRNITVYTMEGAYATEEEIEDLFFRMNNGKALTQQQKSKAKMGVSWAKRFDELSKHPLITDFAAFSKTQISGEKHITAIMQAMMMLDEFYDYKNVSEKEIAEYGSTFKDDQNNKEFLFERVKDGIEYLHKVAEEKEKVLMRKVHFPMLVLTAIEAIDKNHTVYEFRNWMKKFKEEFAKKEENVVKLYDLETNYVEYTGKGTTDRHKADGRLKEMKRHMEAYMLRHKETDEDDASYGI